MTRQGPLFVDIAALGDLTRWRRVWRRRLRLRHVLTPVALTILALEAAVWLARNT
jgi:hypothetical protein